MYSVAAGAVITWAARSSPVRWTTHRMPSAAKVVASASSGPENSAGGENAQASPVRVGHPPRLPRLGIPVIGLVWPGVGIVMTRVPFGLQQHSVNEDLRVIVTPRLPELTVEH
jgi:hypothetical protein